MIALIFHWWQVGFFFTAMFSAIIGVIAAHERYEKTKLWPITALVSAVICFMIWLICFLGHVIVGGAS